MLSGSTPVTKLSVDQLLDRFAKGTPRQRRPLIKQIESRAEELAAVGPELLSGFDLSKWLDDFRGSRKENAHIFC